MARIIFGIQGEGIGHAVRSKIIIEHLSKKHDIEVFASGKAYKYLKGIKNLHKIDSPLLEYKDNQVQILKTFFL